MNIDRFSRCINYLRVAIIDRCNLGCSYFTPPKGIKRLCHSVLSYEKIHFIIKTAARIGFNKVRLSGSKPLVKYHVDNLVQVQQIVGFSEVTDSSITSNGMYLNKMTTDLYNAELNLKSFGFSDRSSIYLVRCSGT
jgi:GTP 3',8-cyclase